MSPTDSAGPHRGKATESQPGAGAKEQGKSPARAAAKEPASKKPAARKVAARKAPSPRRAARDRAPERPVSEQRAPSRAPKPRQPEARRTQRVTAARVAKTAGARVVRAHARYVRTSARKARMVCVSLPGKSVPEARAILALTPREVARHWSKLLESAVANAENNHELLGDDLTVREAYADEGPTLKRFRPRAMGRATPIRKRTSHLTITLAARSK
jgi:ribosomal protein L22